MIKAIGFDFDGTLIVSEKEKEKVMVATFSDVFGVSKGVKKCYISLRGVSRDDKFRKMVPKLIGRKVSVLELKKLHSSFSKHYFNAMKSCPLMGCVSDLKKLKRKMKFMFIVSIEKQTDVKKLAKHCGISGYFDEILGGPISKFDNIKHVLKKHHVDASELMYVGDSPNDILVSKQHKVKSVGLAKEKKKRNYLKKIGAHVTVKDLCRVGELV
ncbi:MAG: HAD hydrolase-like protein [Candidatus Woesearchaeota archaeon]|jgi:phosphoglycolate phosphatase-like HAD superfamily hydrolase|nr:HAD hydrolase-like protein [Candidatus Woesearchaeota archaeon]|tara:strand:+ start:252 stop:890 length:639 start_codon:yes stop_codon:yes gene_type:complete